MDESLLGGDFTEERANQVKAEKLDWDRFELLLDLSYEYYISDESKSDLAGFCRLIVSIGDDFEGEGYQSLPLRGCSHLIGALIYVVPIPGLCYDSM